MSQDVTEQAENSSPKSSNDQSSIGAILQTDFPASLVVFLVALPLCMGIALASGVPVASGLITGMVGGLIVGLFAGSPLQVSGPAAGLTVIIVAIVDEHGLPLLGTVVLIAGLIQASAGLFKLGQWFRAVSPAVIKGMLSGIGVLILASQFHVMVDDKPHKTGLENLITIPNAIIKGLPWPEWRPEDERKFLTRHLKQIGDLHEKQEELHEAVAENLPSNVSKISKTKQTQLVQMLNEMKSDQTTISKNLHLYRDELQEHGIGTKNTDNSRKRREALRAAISANEKALDDVENGDLEDVLESQTKAVETLGTLLASLKNHEWAAKIGILTILLIIGWQAIPIKKIKLIPAPLIAIIIATAAAGLLSVPILYVEIPDRITDGIHYPHWTVISEASWSSLFQAGVVIALVASAETLLCATAVDQMHQGQRTDYDRELFAQGIGNTICGVLGALPMTGVIVRSAANVQAGAKTRWSAVLHGLWLLLFVVAFGFLLRQIPTAALAAILVYTGWKLINPWQIPGLWKYGKSEVAIYLITVGTIVVEDLLTGVLLGLFLSAAKLLYMFSHLEIELKFEEETKKAFMKIRGAATFVRLPILASELEQVPRGYELHVEFAELDYIDHACLELLMNWNKQHESLGGKMVIDWESLHQNFQRTKPTSEKQPESELEPEPVASTS